MERQAQQARPNREMKPKFIDYYMKIAEVTATLSYAKRLNVGAVIVKDNQILATGYNGMPSGWENVCEHEIDGQLVTKPEVLHAETNATVCLASLDASVLHTCTMHRMCQINLSKWYQYCIL